MTPPTTATLLQQLRTTRETDQARRLANAIRWSLLVGGALALPGLLVAVGVVGRG